MRSVEVLNRNISKSLRILFLVLGSIILAISFYLIRDYSDNYVFDLMSFEFYYDSMRIAILAIGVVLGTIFIVINFEFKNKMVSCVSLISIGAILTLSFYNSAIRAVLISIAFVFLFIFIVTRIFRLYSTLSTIVFSFYIYLVVCLFTVRLIVHIAPNSTISPIVLIYVTVTIFLVLYQSFGVWLNRLFISKALGKPNKAETYNSEILKSHIGFIYVFGFFITNATGLLYLEGDYNFYNVVNNCFITAIALNQIQWPHLKS